MGMIKIGLSVFVCVSLVLVLLKVGLTGEMFSMEHYGFLLA